MPTFNFTSPEGKTYSVDGPEGATKEQAFQILQQHIGGAAPQSANQYVADNFPAAPQDSLGSDVGKSAASGLAKGTATAIGLPGDLATLAHAVAPQGVIDKVKAIPGAKFLYDHIPGSQAVLDSASDPLVDPNYQPQTAAGRYTQAVAKNAGPGLATGMGVPATLASSLAGQAAYDATGSHLAEAGASLVGGITAPMLLAARARQAAMPLHDAATVKGIANTQYADPLLRDTTIAPQAAQGIAGDMQAALAGARSRFAPAQAPEVHAAIDRLAESAAGPRVGPPAPVSIEDLHSFRKTLGTIGQETRDFKPTEQATAAGAAKRVLDQYLDNIPSTDVVRGNPIDAVDTLRSANANWRAQSNAQKVGDLIGNGIDQAGTQNSGMNVGNVLRQKFLPLLKNDAAKLRAMGHGQDEIDAVRQVTQGDLTTNLLRRASNMLGGGGGIASTIIGHGISSGVGGTAGYQEGGLPGMVAGTILGAAPGQALRLAANARTLRNAQAVQQQLLAHAPANAGIVARNNAARAANAARYNQAAARNIPNGLLQALMLAKYGKGS